MDSKERATFAVNRARRKLEAGDIEGAIYHIEQSIIDAEKEARRAAIAEYRAGRECCKAERAAIEWIVECEIRAIENVTMSDGLPEEDEGACCVGRCQIIKNKIRARHGEGQQHNEMDWVHANCGGEVSGQEYEKYGWLWKCDRCPEEWDSEDMFHMVRWRDFIAGTPKTAPNGDTGSGQEGEKR